jgi:hypothetical protein
MEEARGVLYVAAWTAAQINANANAETETETKHRPNPKPAHSTGTGTYTDTDAESHIGTKTGDDISALTYQTMGASPTTKPKEAGQPSTSHDDMIEHGRQAPNAKGRQQCATPQHDGPINCIRDQHTAFPPASPGTH